MGNNAKSLKLSVESSLKRLRTTYIDILYVHYWDLHTSVEEIMDSLHHLVAAGTVLYLVSFFSQYNIYRLRLFARQGISDSPAWFVVKANDYAKANGKTPYVITILLSHCNEILSRRFVVYQAPYSVTQRDIEREILPMCRHEGNFPLSFLILDSNKLRGQASLLLSGTFLLPGISGPTRRKNCAGPAAKTAGQ
jgi:aryl-alcohol dehydrogenase-like predicted oxidoreductase